VKFKTELLINKPRLEVWKFFLDREKTSLWQPTLTRIEPLNGIAGQPDAESKWIYDENGREFSLTEKILHCQELSRFESLFQNEFASNTVNNEFIEQSREETLWSMETTYRFKTTLMKILGPLFKRNYVARSWKEMERFKEMVEQG